MRSSFLSFSVFAFSKLNLFALVSVELYSKLGVKLSTAKKCDCLCSWLLLQLPIRTFVGVTVKYLFAVTNMLTLANECVLNFKEFVKLYETNKVFIVSWRCCFVV